jgi:hypothetical protein
VNGDLQRSAVGRSQDEVLTTGEQWNAAMIEKGWQWLDMPIRHERDECAVANHGKHYARYVVLKAEPWGRNCGVVFGTQTEGGEDFPSGLIPRFHLVGRRTDLDHRIGVHP